MGHQPLRIATRASALARWQAEWVAARLAERGVATELVPLTTRGDQQAGPIGAIGGQGLFTREIQRALLEGRADLAVHSLKDLPTGATEGLSLAAVPPREAAGDALVMRQGGSLDDLPRGARVGTGSLRRQAQLWHVRPDLAIEDVRGNVETRLRKLDDGQFAALVLAEAGLRRLGLAGRISLVLPRSVMLPAVGQGALALEAREDDAATRAAIATLDDPTTHQAVLSERALLAALRGGCLAPVGAWARIEADGLLHLDAVVLSRDGQTRLLAGASAPADQALILGQRVADQLLAQGAADLIQAARDPQTGPSPP